MSLLRIDINKRDYEVVCEDGQEEQLLRLSYDLDKRVRELSKIVGTGNQSMLLVMAGLQLLDEINEMRRGAAEVDVEEEIETATSTAVSQITSRVESLAKKLEKKVA